MLSQINKRLHLIILYHIFQLVLFLALKPLSKHIGRTGREEDGRVAKLKKKIIIIII